jgi:hypothetical protein
MSAQLCLILIALFIVYTIALVVYRLWFSPIARFPGPKLAACTYWVEFWYDVVRDGRYGWKIQEWHRQYGGFYKFFC